MVPRRVALAALVACACSMQPRVRERDFHPGEQVVRSSGVQLELVMAKYEDRHLTLQVSITNRMRDELTVAREGVLLAYQKLEFPVADDPKLPVPPSIAVPPGETVQLVLPFAIPIAEDAVLRLRSLQRSGEALELVSLQVPAPLKKRQSDRLITAVHPDPRAAPRSRRPPAEAPSMVVATAGHRR